MCAELVGAAEVRRRALLPFFAYVDAASLGGPSVAGGVVYVGRGDGGLFAYHGGLRDNERRQLWTTSIDSGIDASARPTVEDHSVAGARLNLFEFAPMRPAPRHSHAAARAPWAASATEDCAAAQSADACEGIKALALSPDERHLYAAASGGHTIVAFRRDRATGALAQLPGRAGCMAEVRRGRRSGCRVARALGAPTAIAVSPDGRNVYAGAENDKLTVFRRNLRSGVLVNSKERLVVSGPPVAAAN